MKVVILTVLFVAVIQTAVSQECLPETSTGKTFCYYFNGPKTWKSAVEWCTSRGETIASIKTQEESDLLKNSPQTTFQGEFWTAARDIQELDQFVWDSPKAPVHYNYNPLLPNSPPLDFQTCLAYRRSQGEIGLVMKKCTDEVGYLCEKY